MKKTLALGLALTALAVPTFASAQFGGLGGLAKQAVGGGAASGNVSAADAGTFLTNATASTKNVMIAAALLAQVAKDRNGLASQKAEIEAVSKAQSPSELAAHKEALSSNLSALSSNANLADNIGQAYAQGTSAQKELIATALGNLALGIYRNTQLAGQAPGFVSGAAGNPQLLSRIGDIKTVAALLGLQTKGLATIAPTLPKLFSAVKIAAPAAGTTTAPKTVDTSKF